MSLNRARPNAVIYLSSRPDMTLDTAGRLKITIHVAIERSPEHLAATYNDLNLLKLAEMFATVIWVCDI